MSEKLAMVNVAAEAVVDGTVYGAVVTSTREAWDLSEAFRQFMVEGARTSALHKAGSDKAVVTVLDPVFYDLDLTDDTTCQDRWGYDYPEHDYGDFDCHRCGAEVDQEEALT